MPCPGISEGVQTRNHRRGITYQELVDTVGHLPLRTVDGDLVAGLLGAGKDDLTVELSLQFIELAKAGEELTVVETVNVDNLRGVLGVLSRAC
jgi:hypothetical protein